jgi:hypothetical protein
MSLTKYTFSINDDFLNHAVAPDRLLQEIRASSIVTSLDCINTEGDSCDIWFKAELSPTDSGLLNGLVAVHSGEPLAPGPIEISTSEMLPVQIKDPIPPGRRENHYSHNFCKKETWWQDSERTVNEVLTDNGDHKTFHPAIARHWIDVTHGKIFSEQSIQSTYQPVVKVDGEVVAEHSPGTTDGDYAIDYTTGSVTFISEQMGVVTASYSFARSSLFKVQHSEGACVRVAYVEVTFSKDIGLKDNVWFQLWGNIGAGMQALSNPEIYRTWDDFVRDSMGGVMEVPCPTGTGEAWRMTAIPRYKLRFDYRDLAGIDLDPDLSLEIRMWLEHDTPIEGELAHATIFARKEI